MQTILKLWQGVQLHDLLLFFILVILLAPILVWRHDELRVFIDRGGLIDEHLIIRVLNLLELMRSSLLLFKSAFLLLMQVDAESLEFLEKEVVSCRQVIVLVVHEALSCLLLVKLELFF
jgi:hypothetical protein